MKQLIVMLAMVMLGIAIYGMIAGPSDHSIRGVVSQVWKQEVETRQAFP